LLEILKTVLYIRTSLVKNDGYSSSILTRLVKGLKFAFHCQMNHADTIQKASQLFKSIPIAYFNTNNIDIK